MAKNDNLVFENCADKPADMPTEEVAKEIINRYKQHLAYHPDSHETLYNLGIVYLQIGDVAQAEKIFLDVAKLMPTFDQVHINLGAVYFGIGEWDKCIKSNTRALEINPNNPAAKANLGLAYLMNEDLDQAEKMAKDALQIESDFPQAHNILAVIYESKGDTEKCLTHYKQAVDQGFIPHPKFAEKVEKLLINADSNV